MQGKSHSAIVKKNKLTDTAV